jgi:hypothetical protein
VLWNGDFETGGVPHGATGPSCGTGGADGPDSTADQYSSIQEMGNTACTSTVSMSTSRTRTPDSKRSLKIVMGAKQQREQAVSKGTWRPDSRGSVDQWYGFSIFYDQDWNLGAGANKEISGSFWHNPVAWRCDCPNGSMNLAGDMDMNNENGKAFKSFTTPHMVLRRNTVMNQQGFYKDGLGLDKLDLGPIVVGKWMDFVVHVRWSTTTTGALREAWRDGVHMGSRSSLNAVDTSVERLRLGQYQATNIAHTRTSYFDNVRIGTSYAAVDPSRGETQPTPGPITEPPAPEPTEPPTSGVSPAFVAARSGSSTSSGVRVTTPAAGAGQVALVALAARGNPNVTPPAGWALVRQDVNGTTMRQWIFKRTQSTPAPAQTVTFGLSSPQSAAWTAATYDNVAVATSAGSVNQSSTSARFPAVSSTPGGVAVSFVAAANGSSVTVGDGWRLRGQSSTASATYKVGGVLVDKSVSASGLVAAGAARLGTPAASIGQSVALVPAR